MTLSEWMDLFPHQIWEGPPYTVTGYVRDLACHTSQSPLPMIWSHPLSARRCLPHTSSVSDSESPPVGPPPSATHPVFDSESPPVHPPLHVTRPVSDSESPPVCPPPPATRPVSLSPIRSHLPSAHRRLPRVTSPPSLIQNHLPSTHRRLPHVPSPPPPI
jgi:hypothetical protein